MVVVFFMETDGKVRCVLDSNVSCLHLVNGFPCCALCAFDKGELLTGDSLFEIF